MSSPHPLASLYAAGERDLARERLQRHLISHHGNVSATARSLGLTYTTVQRWVRAWGLAEWLAATYPAAGRIGAANRARAAPVIPPGWTPENAAEMREAMNSVRVVSVDGREVRPRAGG